MAQLKESQREEDHRLPRAVGGFSPNPQPEWNESHQEPHHDDVLPETAGKHAFVGGARLSFHDPTFDRFDGESQPGQAIGDEVDPQNVGRKQRQGESHEWPEEHDPDLTGVGCEGVADEAADVVVDAAPLSDRRNDGCEVVVGEHHVGCFPGNLGSGHSHGDANIGDSQSRGVVHAVAGHCDDVAPDLPGLDDIELLLR